MLGEVLGLLSFAGGLFIPVEQFGHVFATLAAFTPVGAPVVSRPKTTVSS